MDDLQEWGYKTDLQSELAIKIKEISQVDSGSTGKICAFCKKNLEPRIIRVFDTDRTFGYKECGCQESVLAIAGLAKEYERMEQEAKFAEQQRKIKRLINSSMMGLRFQDRVFENYIATIDQQTKALKAATEFCTRFYANRHCKGLFLSGTVGTGKTHLAAAVANKVMKEYFVPVMFGTAPGLLNKIKNSFSDDNGGNITDMLCDVPLLIIDDLGKEYAKKNNDGWSWVHETIYEVINRRYENYLPIIVTTNLTLSELETRIDAAIVSRIIEMCDGIQCDWGDYRMGKVKKFGVA